MPVTINGNGSITGISVGGLGSGVVNTASIVNGAVTNVKHGPGSVINVASTKYRGVTSFAADSNFTRNISDINTTITTVGTNSTFLVNVYMMGEGNDNDSNYRCRLTRTIGGTETRLGGNDAGSRAGVFQLPTEGHDSGNTAVTLTYVNIANYHDEPGTLASGTAVTYKLYIQNQSGQTWYLNRTKNDTDAFTCERGLSYMTIMEVKA